MTRRLHAAGAALACLSLFAFTACGGDDGGSGSLSADQRTAVDKLMTEVGDSGMKVERSCVEKVAAKLSPADAKAIAEAGPGEDPTLSDEGEALSSELFSCVDTDALVDLMVGEMDRSGVKVDRDCVKKAIGKLSAEDFAGDEPSEEAFGLIFECVDLGG